MATYKGIQGYSVQTLASDPSPTQSVEGQLWYNSTAGSYKIATSGSGAWAAGGDMPVATKQQGCFGIQTAAVSMGNSPATAVTSEYNGTVWALSNDSNSARRNMAALGTLTAGMCAGGSGVDSTASETYDGTSWASTPGINSGRQGLGGGGTITAAVIAAGNPALQLCEEYNGTAWSELNNLNNGRQNVCMGGTTQATTVCAGGGPPSVYLKTETYNATSWTEVNNLNSGKIEGGASSYGTTTAFLAFGSEISPHVATEKYDGSSWTEVGDLATNRTLARGAGTNTAAICAGGATPSITAATENFNDPVYAVKTVTVS